MWSSSSTSWKMIWSAVFKQSSISPGFSRASAQSSMGSSVVVQSIVTRTCTVSTFLSLMRLFLLPHLLPSAYHRISWKSILTLKFFCGIMEKKSSCLIKLIVHPSRLSDARRAPTSRKNFKFQGMLQLKTSRKACCPITFS